MHSLKKRILDTGFFLFLLNYSAFVLALEVSIGAKEHQIRSFLQDKKNEYNNRVFPVGNKDLVVDLEYSSVEDMINHEKEVFFDLKWHENQIILNKIADYLGQNGEGFRRKDGFVAVYFGSSLTYQFYVQDGLIQSMIYHFGTSSTFKDQPSIDNLNNLMFSLASTNKPKILFGAIGFAKFQNMQPTCVIDLSQNLQLTVPNDRNVLLLHSLVNRISHYVKDLEVQNFYLYCATSKRDKFHSSSFDLLAYNQVFGNSLGFLGDQASHSKTVYLVHDGVVDRSAGVIIGREKERARQHEILQALKRLDFYTANGYFAHDLSEMIDATKRWIVENDHLAHVREQRVFHLRIGISSLLGNLYKKNLALPFELRPPSDECMPVSIEGVALPDFHNNLPPPYRESLPADPKAPAEEVDPPAY